ncbi:MAG: hypothetical protein ACP5RE_03595 [Candidatus Acidifodinimicrobium sp.]
METMEEIIVVEKKQLLEYVKKKYVEKFSEWLDENLTIDDLDDVHK